MLTIVPALNSKQTNNNTIQRAWYTASMLHIHACDILYFTYKYRFIPILKAVQPCLHLSTHNYIGKVCLKYYSFLLVLYFILYLRVLHPVSELNVASS